MKIQKHRFQNPLLCNESINLDKESLAKTLIEDEKEMSSQTSQVIKPQRSPKQTLALVFGYVGTAFHGMQKQLNSQGEECVRTVEGELEKAIFQCYGYDRNPPMKTKGKWSRVARTDKGVHAVAQVVAFRVALPNAKMCNRKREKEQGEQTTEEHNAVPHLSDNQSTQEDSYCDFVNQIQSFLDDAGYQESIKLFKIYRVTKSFDARLQCSGRCYQYLLPLSALRKVQFSSEAVKHEGFIYYGLTTHEEASNIITTAHTPLSGASCKSNESDTPDKEIFYHQEALPLNSPTSVQEEIANTTKETLCDLLQNFLGTHNFHNFTPGGISSNPSMCRYVESIKVTWEWMGAREPVFIITIQGQSFLLHQIRKMIGLVVEIMCGSAPKTAVLLSLNPTFRVNTLMVPGAGLLLDHANYDQYNQYRATPPKTPLLTFHDISERLKEFREKSIYSTIVKQIEENDCQLWNNWHQMVARYPFFHTNYPLEELPRIQRKKQKQS